jgi:hypothetical protein
VTSESIIVSMVGTERRAEAKRCNSSRTYFLECVSARNEHGLCIRTIWSVDCKSGGNSDLGAVALLDCVRQYVHGAVCDGERHTPIETRRRFVREGVGQDVARSIQVLIYNSGEREAIRGWSASEMGEDDGIQETAGARRWTRRLIGRRWRGFRDE